MIRVAAAAVLLGALAAAAAPAGADPNPFGGLGCHCTPTATIPVTKPRADDQIDLGIQNGLGSLHRVRAPRS